MKILIAEDTQSARRLLERTLEKWGHEVISTEDGEEALTALQQSDVSLIIADWMMPKMDGIELCRRIRGRKWDRFIYILMLTAVTEKADLAEAMGAGADDYVTKPFDKIELKARIEAGTRMLKLERKLAEHVAELEESLRTIRQLKELLPICMYCKAIRTDNDYWQRIDEYLHTETGTDFSHGICPDCYEKIVKPQLAELDHAKQAQTCPSHPDAPPTKNDQRGFASDRRAVSE